MSTGEDFNLKVILVDDNPAHRKLIKRALLLSGITCTIIEADSLAAARAIFFSATSSINPTDSLQINKQLLILLDLNLSDGRGTELLTELRSKPNFESALIVMLSTSALQSDLEESLALGASGFLTKSTATERFTAELLSLIKGLSPIAD